MKNALITSWKAQGYTFDRQLIDAFTAVSREDFVHASQKDEAYIDYPMPISHGQTISQPLTVMLMTQALELKSGEKVLEVGAGSGYQAAIISKLVEPGKVVSTEIISGLAAQAQANLAKSKIRNVDVLNYDGSQGYPPEAPYDKIIVTAACPSIPLPLIEQLREGGILVAPVGPLSGQQMIKAKKLQGKLIKQSLGMFVFVPLKGRHGF
ncbi:MAG: protein-L-isoaspartate(D-aspartate) O-methyltransferase [Candidatus Woesearchaeota archaeon]